MPGWTWQGRNGAGVGKRIVLVNDLCSYGTVSLTAMDAVLSRMGYATSLVPTALVSSTFNREEVAVLETGSYVRGAFSALDRLGVEFAAVATGYIATEDEAHSIADFCRKKAEEGAAIFVDPIMGDNGSLYHGVDSGSVERMRKLLALSDYAVPNATEACLLAGMDPSKEELTEKEAEELVARLRELDAGSLAITSCRVEGADCVLGYDREEEKIFRLPIDYIPCYFAGTGDIFSSVMLGKVLAGVPFEEAVRSAMDLVRTLIWRHKAQEDVFLGLPLEEENELLGSLA